MDKHKKSSSIPRSVDGKVGNLAIFLNSGATPDSLDMNALILRLSQEELAINLGLPGLRLGERDGICTHHVGLLADIGIVGAVPDPVAVHRHPLRMSTAAPVGLVLHFSREEPLHEDRLLVITPNIDDVFRVMRDRIDLRGVALVDSIIERIEAEKSESDMWPPAIEKK